MTSKRLTSLTVTVLAAAWLSGYETKKQLPTVNDENCKHASLVKIEDDDTRQKLASLCIRRSVSGTFKPSPKREW